MEEGNFEIEGNHQDDGTVVDNNTADAPATRGAKQDAPINKRGDKANTGDDEVSREDQMCPDIPLS